MNEPIHAEPESFVWPPNREPSGSLPEKISAKEQSFLSSLIESVETDLLGREALAFDVWASRYNWEPDAEDVYCWRCAGSVGPHERDGDGCVSCRMLKLPWDRALRLGTHTGRLRAETLSLKFHTWRPSGRGLGRELGEVIRAKLDDAQVPIEQARLIPIPTHPWRRIRRGIDHTMLLADAAGLSSGCRTARVLRARYRPEQVGLSATARARNMRGAFRARQAAIRRVVRRVDQPVRVWVLIDDVRTTGATLTAGAKELRKALNALRMPKEKSSIWVCSVGVAADRDRRESR